MLKIKDGFTMRHAGDTFLIVSSLPEDRESPKIFSINESGALLWNELLAGTDKTGLIMALQSEYETDNIEIIKDIEDFLEGLRNMGVLDED